jgi:hypothetical protein
MEKEQKKIAICGGSGFIGAHLTEALIKEGFRVSVIDLFPPKNKNIEFFKADLTQTLDPNNFDGACAVVNLSGKNLFTFPTKKNKLEIRNSRILATRNIIHALGNMKKKPEVFVSASATGYYGDRGDEILTEESSPGGDWIAKLCVDWEHEAQKAESLGVRSVQIRTAPVLGKGGLLKKLSLFLKFGIYPQFGNGKQWFSWISVGDLLRIYKFALENNLISGAVNASSGNPIKQKEFLRLFAQKKRFAVKIPIPKFFIKIVYGELSPVAFSSQKAVPQSLLRHKFNFQCNTIEDFFNNFQDPR